MNGQRRFLDSIFFPEKSKVRGKLKEIGKGYNFSGWTGY